MRNMPINAFIFAHILKDSSLTGTYGLTGNHFVNALFAMVSVLINNDWRFFKAKTASAELVDKVQEHLTSALNSL